MWYEMKLVGLWGHLNSQWNYVVVEYRLWSQMDLSLNPAFLELCNHAPSGCLNFPFCEMETIVILSCRTG